jgi:hypothetical protein
MQVICEDCACQTGVDLNAVKTWNTRHAPKNPYTVDATHTDPAEAHTALALKYRQRARAAEGLLAVAEKALEVYRDRDKQLEDILGKPETFLPECSDRKTKGSVSKCDNPYNFRFTGPCSKRCANPTKPLNKGESK